MERQKGDLSKTKMKREWGINVEYRENGRQEESEIDRKREPGEERKGDLWMYMDVRGVVISTYESRCKSKY